MATITANISASAGLIPLSAPVPIGFYTIDSENIEVTGASRGAQGRAFNRKFASVNRGVGGSTAATHTSGATLTRYYPDAATAGGFGGVTVDNGTDPPVSVTSIVAPGAVIVGDEATLAGAVFSGARYVISQANGSPITIGSGNLLVGWARNDKPFYDTDNYAVDGFDGGGQSNGFYFETPFDGYYEIAANMKVDFDASDATYLWFLILSPDRDNEWDDYDHFTFVPAEQVTGQPIHKRASVKHWMAAGDRIGMKQFHDASGTNPSTAGAIEVQFLGTGANPVVP